MSAEMTQVEARTDSETRPTARDLEVEEAVRDAIRRLSNIRIWGHAVQIHVRNGTVELVGHVRTRASKETAGRIASEVAGVNVVANHLYVDTDLEIAVAQALGKDPRTMNSFPGILVGSAFGEMFLKGNVASQEIKQAAQEIAAKVAGVRQVTNQLVAPEPPKPAAPAKPAAAKPAPKPAPKPAEEEASETEGE